MRSCLVPARLHGIVRRRPGRGDSGRSPGMEVDLMPPISPVWLGLLLFVVLLLASEVGYWFGRRLQPHSTGDFKSHVTTMESSVLGLLALLLSFTFVMAASRYDTRKQLVLDEANAIGTTYLRTDLLPGT